MCVYKEHRYKEFQSYGNWKRQKRIEILWLKGFFFLNQKENPPVERTEDWLVYKKVSVNLKTIQ